jgi:hypothetical protein
MHRSALIAAICVGLPIQVALGEDPLPITNVTITMIRHGGKAPFGSMQRYQTQTISPYLMCTYTATSETGEATV